MSESVQRAYPSLPCYPCPYAASCCAYGSSLDEAEALAIEAARGKGLVYKTRWGEWRTRVRNGRCALLKDGACTIHAETFYPSVCRGFPWVDGDGTGPYQYDVTICGELASKPELVALHRAPRVTI